MLVDDIIKMNKRARRGGMRGFRGVRGIHDRVKQFRGRVGNTPVRDHGGRGRFQHNNTVTFSGISPLNRHGNFNGQQVLLALLK